MKKGRHIFVKALCAVLAFAIIFSVSACQGNSNTEEAQSVTAEPVENGLSASELAVQYGSENPPMRLQLKPDIPVQSRNGSILWRLRRSKAAQAFQRRIFLLTEI